MIYLILIFLMIFKLKGISAKGSIYTSDSGNQFFIETEQKVSYLQK